MSDYKILELAKPILRTWSSESNLESIALLQKNAIEWMYDNYINLLGSWNCQKKAVFLSFIPKHYSSPLCDVSLSAWLRCPFLTFCFVSHDFVRNKYENILEYIMRAIEEGYYILLNIQQKNLSIRAGDDLHKTFIYGFDKKEKILYVADHYNNGKYALAKLGFDEYVEAYESTYWGNKDVHMLESGNKMICENNFFTIAKPKAFKYEFNLEWFKLQLKDYLDSTYRLHCVAVVTETEDNKRYFGINCYNLVLDYLDELIKNDECSKDRRIFTLICDHKRLLKMRMDFLKNKKICHISDEEMERYDMLTHLAENVLNLFLKYMVSGNKRNLRKIQKIIAEMKRMEFKLLTQLQEKLELQNII